MRLGVLGTGMIARLIVPHLEEWGCTVGAVCSTPRSVQAARELAGTVAAAEVHTDLAAMLAQTDIDTVYLAVPNHLHHGAAIRALEAGKHVIVEKPIASTVEEARDLAATARERGLMLAEAITTLHQPNYAKLREFLPRIGDIKIVSCNFSQYSSRYDAFRAGTVLPAFDPAKSGGALMDLGVYNMHWLIGLFGEPVRAAYHANIERGIDTSGVMELDYGSFKAVSVAAKDCAAPSRSTIQGTRGYLALATPPSSCGGLTLHLNDGTEERVDLNPENQWESAFRSISAMIDAGDRERCEALLRHSVAVSHTMTEARRAAGIWFAADAPYRGARA
ncbi:MAG: Gfo/Idh/MocA family oxidoreductase [Coriobacteriaceae bacterium]|nr:Gfo/Idh/MocA family oxidoreductase [Coriobacteriaceae bacterium]